MAQIKPEVLVLSTADRQIGDDLYINGRQYTIDADRAGKYEEYFKVLTVNVGDKYDGMKVVQLRDIAKGLDIPDVGARTKRAELLEAIRLRNAAVDAAGGDRGPNE